jgi:hypothetical protein
MKQVPDRKKLRREHVKHGRWDDSSHIRTPFLSRLRRYGIALISGGYVYSDSPKPHTCDAPPPEKRVPDRKQLRREYLKQKGGAVANITVSGLLLLPVSVALLLFLTMIFVFAFSPSEPIGERVVLSCFAIALAGLAGAGVSICVRDIRETKRKARQLIYVPPVTPDTLPAEEILIRGSQEPPVAQSEVLLRAAKETEAPLEELLHVNQTEK